MSGAGPILHRNVTLLRVEGPEILAEIRALVDLSGFVVAQLDPVTLIVDPARTGALAQALGDAGLAPLVQKRRPTADPDPQDPPA